MDRAGGRSATTVLIFLGTCLAFAEAALAFIAQKSESNDLLIALFALAALAMVLSTLAFMYWINPGFLTIEGSAASELAIIQTIAARRPEAITPHFLLSLLSRGLTQRVTANVDEGLEKPVIVKEAFEIQEALSELEQAQRLKEE